MRRLVLLAASLCLAAPAVAAPGDAGGFVARTLDGETVSLTGARGRVLIVNFWATWCAPCRAELPALDAWYRAHRAEGVTMLAISLDAGARPARLRGATAGFAFAVARIDDVAMPRTAIPVALPHTRVYDRAGRLRHDSGTPLDPAALERIATPLLAEVGR